MAENRYDRRGQATLKRYKERLPGVNVERGGRIGQWRGGDILYS